MRTTGDYRHCFVQLKTDKRRRRRGKIKENKHTTPLWERVSHILNNGTICDYTHPKEVDPYWKKLYQTFEYLTYLEYVFFTSIIKKDSPVYENDFTYNMYFIANIEKIKKDLRFYMMNFMELLYGSVLKNRFYGWKNRYGTDMASQFKEISMDNINRLKFNADQTRCSIYFYQMFWLNGIVYTKNISTELKRKYNEQEETNRGNKVFSYESDDIENISLDMMEEPSQEFFIDNIESKDENNDDFNEETNVNHINEEESYTLEQIEESSSQYKKQQLAHNLLDKLNISRNWLYNSDDKQITSLGKKIKNYLKKGKITLSQDERELLEEIFDNGNKL